MQVQEKHVWLTIGISGSGKSTWQRQFIAQEAEQGKLWVAVERDELRKAVLAATNKTAYQQDLNWSAWDWDWEHRVNHLQSQMFHSLLSNSAVHGIIISDTNISVGGRNKLYRRLQEEFGIKQEHIYTKRFDVDVEVAIARDAKRKYPVGENVIRDQYAKLNLQQQ